MTVYDCVQALWYWGNSILSELVLVDKSCQSSSSRLLPLAVYFDLNREFQAITVDMVYLTNTTEKPDYGIAKKFLTLLPDGFLGRFLTCYVFADYLLPF